MTDLFAKFDSTEGYFGRLRAVDDHYFTRPILDPQPDTLMRFDDRDVVMWSINNYLGLANHPDVIRVAHEAVDEFGVSAPMGSRMMTGNTDYHRAFEQRLADLARKEAAFVFNYGYLGVMGTIQALAGPDDVVLMDKLAHACIVDGAFLTRGQVRVFKHNNPENLEIMLKRISRDHKGGVLVVTEGVYGMTGDIAPLPEICEIKDRYGARLFVDDAHGWGVMGERGRGTADYVGVQDKVDAYFGTFAKSFASIGGFTATTKAARDWISYNARTQVFAKSLPMVYIKTLDRTLDLVAEADERRNVMWRNSNALKDALRGLGYYIGDGESPICSVFAPISGGDPEEIGMQLVSYLRKAGIFVTGITYPVIPVGLMMFRMIPTANHTQDDIDRTVEVFRRMRDEMKLDLNMQAEDQTKLERIYGKRPIAV